MGSRQSDNCERVLPSPSCLDGMHEECGHWRGYRAALNLRRLRREGFATLCRCDCHSSCPVTSEENTVDDSAWRQSCICPGAEAIRRMRDEFEIQSFDFADFREGWAKYRRESQSRREAFTAAQASAAGTDREHLKGPYVAELRSRGLTIPDDEDLDAAIDAQMGDYLTGPRLVGREVVNLGKLIGSFRHPR
jgi:hypothetical protein